jgi:PAS domain-containing protein
VQESATDTDHLQRRIRGVAARENEEPYRLLFELNPNPMFIFNESSLRFLAVNESAVKLYGWSPAEFLDKTIKEVRPSEDVPYTANVLLWMMLNRARSSPALKGCKCNSRLACAWSNPQPL